MMAVEMMERCAVCPARGLCTPCRPLTVKGESGSGEVLVFKGSVKELLSLPKLPRRIVFNTDNPVSLAGQVSGEPPINKFVSNEIRTGEKTCSECNKPASTCSHSEASKR